MYLLADPACTDVAGQLSDRGALSGRLDFVHRARPTTPRTLHKCTRTVVSLCPPAAFRRIRTPPPTPLPRLANNLQQRNGHGQGNHSGGALLLLPLHNAARYHFWSVLFALYTSATPSTLAICTDAL